MLPTVLKGEKRIWELEETEYNLENVRVTDYSKGQVEPLGLMPCTEMP